VAGRRDRAVITQGRIGVKPRAKRLAESEESVGERLDTGIRLWLLITKSTSLCASTVAFSLVNQSIPICGEHDFPPSGLG